MEIAAKAIERLEKSFEHVHDKRRHSRDLGHNLPDMPVIAFTAGIYGLKDYEDMENPGWGKERWFKTFLKLPHGIPDKNTFQRLFTRIDPGELLSSPGTWLEAVNIDGKTIWGSKDGAKQTARHMVSARVGEQHLGLGQVKTEEKGNEITVIPELVALPDLTGATVTIDAMGCQKGIAEKQAWYVLAVKGNHPELYDQIAEYFRWVEEEGVWDERIEVWKSGCEKDHGRIHSGALVHRERVTLGMRRGFRGRSGSEGSRSGESQCGEEGGYSSAERAGAREKDKLQAPDVQGVNEGRLPILPLWAMILRLGVSSV